MWWLLCASAKMLLLFSSIDTATVLNIVGIAVGAAIAAFFLLLVLPIVIVTIIACRLCNRRNRYETVIVNPAPAPTTTVYSAGYGTRGY